MSFGRFRLLSQTGIGRDSVRYRAIDRQDGTTVDLYILAEAKKDTERWRAIGRRFRKVAMLDDPSAIQVVAIDLEADPPFVALEWFEARTLADDVPDEYEHVSTMIDLAESLAAGHRLGLAHGRIAEGEIKLRGPGAVALDWSGFDLDTEPEPAADVFALGLIIGGRLCDSPALDPTVEGLIRGMLDPTPAARPSSREVATNLAAALITTRGLGVKSDLPSSDTLHFASLPDSSAPPPSFAREQLGRFRLIEAIGQGGMGTVYRAEDLADGTSVAIKVLKPVHAARPEALIRFHKEARLLAEVNNPRVANLIEVNEDDGVHYLAIEFVAGQNLARWLADRGTVDEPTAMAILADVARALELAHSRGIVHRDIKPENIIILDAEAEAGAGVLPRAKLLDFGLARHVVETESLDVTRDGAILGTPLYMSPEQCAGEKEIGPGSDVYAMGATLFAVMAGRPPFRGDTPLIVMSQHRDEPPPALRSLVPSASDAAASIVAKALAKTPLRRYADAGEMLADIERLMRGEPTGINVHPRMPDCDPREIVSWDWRWDLEATPRALWPMVSNTERFNRAIGLSPVEFQDEADAEMGSKRLGKFRKTGLDFAWREHPFEWVEGRRMGVVREFDKGPFEWFVSIVELEPKGDGGTLLTHKVRVKPRGVLGRTVAAVEIGTRGRKAIDRVYRRIDATLTGKLGRDPAIDPFEAPEPLPAGKRRRLERWLDSLGEAGFATAVVERLGDFLEIAPAQDVARIRPLALARRLDLDADAVVAACLRGASDGVLVLLWDLLCPVCRIPSQVMGTLRALQDHGHCTTCQLDYELDFANSVELIFRVHPEIRDTDLGTYCSGSPAHSPHVAAQARVGPGERVKLDLALEAGSYRFRGPQLGYTIDFRVEPSCPASRWLLDLKLGPDGELPRVLRPGSQGLDLVNPTEGEVIVRVERIAPRDDALTAARASSLALFRELFPGEVLSPGQLINLDTVTLLVTDLDRAGGMYTELGDARAFGIVHDQFRVVDRCVRLEGGAMVKTVHEGTVSAFSDPAAAVKASIKILEALAESESTRALAVRVGVHRGSAMVATLNDHLDYFGTTVSVSSKLPKLGEGGQIVLTRPVASDPAVVAVLAGKGLDSRIVEVDVEGLAEPFVHVVGPSR